MAKKPKQDEAEGAPAPKALKPLADAKLQVSGVMVKVKAGHAISYSKEIAAALDASGIAYEEI